MGNRSRGGRYEPYPGTKPAPIKNPNSPRSKKRKELLPVLNDPLARFSLPPRPPPGATNKVSSPGRTLPARPQQGRARTPNRMRTPKRRALKERLRRSTTPGHSSSPSRATRVQSRQHRGSPPRLSLPNLPTSRQQPQARPPRNSLPAPTTSISTTVDLTGPDSAGPATRSPTITTYKFHLPIPSSVRNYAGPTPVHLRISAIYPFPLTFLESLPALSIQLQLRLLTYLQSRAEESMYRFCSRCFPLDVRREGWTSRELVELNHIARLLLRKDMQLPGGREPARNSANKMSLTTVQRIRHVAVHRQPVSTCILWGFVQCVMDCAYMIGDLELGSDILVFDRIFKSEVLDLRKALDGIAKLGDVARYGGAYKVESEKLIEGFKKSIEGRIKVVLDSKVAVHQALVLGSRKDLPVMLEDD